MHLTLVQKRCFDFSSADFTIPIPADIAVDNDALDSGTPVRLSALAYFFSDWEAGYYEPPHREPEDAFWFAKLADFKGTAPVGAQALVTPHYARLWVANVFAQWQARNPTRSQYALQFRDSRIGVDGMNKPGLVVRLIQREDASNG